MTDSASTRRAAGSSPDLLALFVKVASFVIGCFFLGIGLWILFGPRSFYDALAVFPPYNRHFLHDAGAFQIGLGVMVLLSLRWSDALTVTLTGISVASWSHVLAHSLDRHIGGRPSTDIPGLAFLALVATIAAIARAALLKRTE